MWVVGRQCSHSALHTSTPDYAAQLAMREFLFYKMLLLKCDLSHLFKEH